MQNIREMLIYHESANFLDEKNEPIWYSLMEKNCIDDILLLLNNNLDVSIKNKNNDSWLISCIKFKMPAFILVAGLNKDDHNWFKPNNNKNSPFFNIEIPLSYVDIIGQKYWQEGHSWKNLTSDQDVDIIDFFKKNDMIEIARRFSYWKKISLRR